MKTWVTTIWAKSPIDETIRKYGGPNVPGISETEAKIYCEENGLGYCHVIGELVSEIPCFPGTHNPDFDNKIDYELPQQN